MTIEELIVKETGKTFDEIRAMSNVELYAFIDDIRLEAWSEGYEERENYI